MTDRLPPIDDNQAETEKGAPADYTAPMKAQGTAPMRPVAPPRPAQGGHVAPTGDPRRRTQQQRPARRPNPRQTGAYPPAQMPRTQKVRKQDSGLYLPWWSLVLMLLGVLVVTFLIVGGVFLLGDTAPTTIQSNQPVIRIITAEATIAQPSSTPAFAQGVSTQVISGNNAPTTLDLAGPTLEAVQFTPTPVPITVGTNVVVDGVDAQQLNIRDNAGVNGTNVLHRANEGETFIVVGGPTQADGFTWWRVQDPRNATRVGWVVSNFIQVAEN